MVGTFIMLACKGGVVVATSGEGSPPQLEEGGERAPWWALACTSGEGSPPQLEVNDVTTPPSACTLSISSTADM